MFAGRHLVALLVILLGVGGLSPGTAFSNLGPPHESGDFEVRGGHQCGVFTTSLQVAGAAGVAGFGTTYLALLSRPGADPATPAFAVIAAGFALTVVAGGGAAYRARHSAVYPRPVASRPAASSIRSWRSAPVTERGSTAIRAR